MNNLNNMCSGTLTGYNFTTQIREEWAGNQYGVANGEELGTLDAPERIAAGCCYIGKENVVTQKQIWR